MWIDLDCRFKPLTDLQSGLQPSKKAFSIVMVVVYFKKNLIDGLLLEGERLYVSFSADIIPEKLHCPLWSIVYS